MAAILAAMQKNYSHRQIGTQSLIAHSVGFIILGWLFFRVDLVGVSLPMFAALAMLLGVSSVAFTTMICTVNDGEFRVACGLFGWPDKRVALDDIAGVLPTKTALISGFGIRITTRGWLYSVSGRDAVIVGLRDGKQFLIGSDEPIKLADAINQALGRSPSFTLIKGAMVERMQ
ncbi:MAG: hypothetical protein ABI583_07330 [Betaproteobacteria bacterium]